MERLLTAPAADAAITLVDTALTDAIVLGQIIFAPPLVETAGTCRCAVGAEDIHQVEQIINRNHAVHVVVSEDAPRPCIPPGADQQKDVFDVNQIITVEIATCSWPACFADHGLMIPVDTAPYLQTGVFAHHAVFQVTLEGVAENSPAVIPGVVADQAAIHKHVGGNHVNGSAETVGTVVPHGALLEDGAIPLNECGATTCGMVLDEQT